MSRNRVVDPYYLKRAAQKGIPTEFIPPSQPAAVDPVQQAAIAKLTETLRVNAAADGARAAIDQAANNSLLRGAGQPPSPYDIYRSARYGSPSEMSDPAGADGARGMLPLGGGSGPQGAYNPAGIPASVETAGGPRTATVTGNPFFDVNTDFNQLEKERTLKNQNDAVFTAQNNRRLGAIAEARNAADQLRAQNLASQGMTQEQIDMRMHPERFAAPKDPAIEQAKAIDLAERQGRGNLHAIASKFRRNGLSPAAAYAAALNTMPTTDPANQGAVPSLPAMDPMKIAAAFGAGPGMAAGQYGTGMENSGNNLLARGQESRDRRDVGMAQANASGQGGMLEFILGLLKHQQGHGLVNQQQSAETRQQAMDWLQANPNAANSPDPNQRSMHQRMTQQAIGGGGNNVMPGNQGANPLVPPGNDWRAGGSPAAPLSGAFNGGASSNPIFGQNTPQQLVGNPMMMQQWLATLPPAEQDMRRAQAYVEAGMGGDPTVGNYLRGRYENDNPNLFEWWPDWMSTDSSAAAAAAAHAARNYGIPADVAQPIYVDYFNR